MMKKLTQALLLALAFAAVAAAQTPSPSPTPFDAFGDIQPSDWLARLDNLAISLQNDPSSRGHIVAYANKYKLPGWPYRRANWARTYLVKTRGLDASRVSVVNGGFRAEDGFELWLVRAGEREPFEAGDASLAFAGERAPLKVDVFYSYDAIDPMWQYDGSYSEYFEGRHRYDFLAEHLRADPSLRAVVIAYATRRDRRGEDRRLAARTKLTILKLHPVAPARLIATGGGLRQHRTIEVWLVPPGSPPPKPTPTVRPAKRRRR